MKESVEETSESRAVYTNRRRIPLEYSVGVLCVFPLEKTVVALIHKPVVSNNQFSRHLVNQFYSAFFACVA